MLRTKTILRPALLAMTMGVLSACQSSNGGDPAAKAAQPSSCDLATQASEAPPELRDLANPLADDGENLAAGRRLYQRDAMPVACVECHGPEGRGDGPIGVYLSPPPTNFTCTSETTDGQLFWVIREGSNYLGSADGRPEVKRPGRRPAGTAMRPHRYYLSEEETWQLVLYLRQLQEEAP